MRSPCNKKNLELTQVLPGLALVVFAMVVVQKTRATRMVSKGVLDTWERVWGPWEMLRKQGWMSKRCEKRKKAKLIS